MGRIRTTFIKGIARRLFEKSPDQWGGFETNKKVLNEMKLTDEKFTRNKVAGYIVRLVEQKARSIVA